MSVGWLSRNGSLASFSADRTMYNRTSDRLAAQRPHYCPLGLDQNGEAVAFNGPTKGTTLFHWQCSGMGDIAVLSWSTILKSYSCVLSCPPTQIVHYSNISEALKGDWTYEISFIPDDNMLGTQISESLCFRGHTNSMIGSKISQSL